MYRILFAIIAVCSAAESQTCGVTPSFNDNEIIEGEDVAYMYLNPNLKPRIIGGETVEQNEFPWIVAFIYWPMELFFSSGNLISKKHILSGALRFIVTNNFLRHSVILAAHCFQQKSKKTKISPQYVSAILGRFNLTDNNEEG